MIALAVFLFCVDGGIAPPAVLLDVSWGEGLKTGRIARIVIDAPVAIAGIAGTLAKKPVIAFEASVDRKKWVVLAPVDVEAKPLPVPLILDVTLASGIRVRWQKPAPIVEAPYEERKLTVDKKFIKPSYAERMRARKEAHEMGAVLDAPHKSRLWRGSFARPTPGVETSPFGTRRTYVNDKNKKKSRHLGLDLNGAIGDAITAANRGRIALASNRFYSGGTVVIDHGQGLFTMYFHMSRIDVKPGDVVEKGQGLGAVGASGQVTGPHLHFSVKLDGMYQDPHYMLALDLSDDALDVPSAH